MDATPSTAAVTARRFALLPEGPVEVPLPDGANSMHSAMAGLPAGVYSGLRSFPGGRFLELDAHVARMERSARSMGFELGAEREVLLTGLQRVVDDARPQDLRVRFDLLPEPFTLDGVSARLWMATAPYAPVPQRFLEHGVRVEVAEGLARETPLVKTTEFVERRRPYPLETDRAYEHLLLDAGGHVLECSSANVYAICGGRLVTAGSGVLEGITRALVLRIAREEGLEVELRAPHLDEVLTWDEAFLSSSTRALVPIVDVAGVQVGHGRPGPWTQRLTEAYARLAEREAARVLPERVD